MPATTRTYELIVSLFIAGVLLLQTAAMGDRFFGTKLGGRKLWPILNYLMYDDPHYEGETIQAYYPLEGTLRDGTVVQIAQEDLGLSFWNFLHLGDRLAQDPPADVAILLKLYKKSDQLVEVRVKTLPLMITRTGQAYKESVVVRTIPVDAAARANAAHSTAPSGEDAQ